MKKHFTIIALIMTFGLSAQQEFEISTNSIEKIVEFENMTKNDIFIASNKWVSINYNSANNVIQMSDKDAGELLVKGVYNISFKNGMKKHFKNKKAVKSELENSFAHTLDISIKDGKVKFKITFTDVLNSNVTYAQYQFPKELIGLSGGNKDYIDAFKHQMNENFKSALIGKRKREKYTGSLDATIISLNEELIKTGKNTIKSITEYILSFDGVKW